MSGALHQQLVERGARWLMRQGFGVVATELTVAGVAEQVDGIGFRATCSAVLEAKASRTDFRADRHKPHRQAGGLGNYRFFVCPSGLIQPDELPERWGLLWTQGRGLQLVVGPSGNLWPSHAVEGLGTWAAFWHSSDAWMERKVLYSIARR